MEMRESISTVFSSVCCSFLFLEIAYKTLPMWFLYHLVVYYPQSKSIFKCIHGAPLYTTGHPVGMDLKQMNWSTTWVGQLLCSRGKSHLVSSGVGDPAETVELITLVTSFLTFAYILMWEQEAFSGVFLVAC